MLFIERLSNQANFAVSFTVFNDKCSNVSYLRRIYDFFIVNCKI